MEDCDAFSKVSYLQARDPSIIFGWNRPQIVRHNLFGDYETESTISSIPSEKQDNHIKVYLRIKGGVDNDDTYTVEDDNLICKVPDGSHTARNNKDNGVLIRKYQFTHIFGPETSQQDLFDSIIKPKIFSFINGHNSSLLAYGSSGSGKTFTMVGTTDQPGIIPRALEYLFRSIPAMRKEPQVKPLPNGKVIVLTNSQSKAEYQNAQSLLPLSEKLIHVKTYRAMQQRLSNNPVAIVDHSVPILSVYVSFAEIYNEYIYDLLRPPPGRDQRRPKLKIGGLEQHYIKGLSFVYVRSGLEAYQVLQHGTNNLKYADTAVNDHSSRSHCIFTIRLVQGWDVENSQVSTFNFCDLAGSERLKKTKNVGDRLKESNNINGSLLVLGRCISIIRDRQVNNDNTVPPFRESKLTQIFQRALMGKEDIVMVVNINPSPDMFDESHHTLNFAGIAKEIILEEQPPKLLKPNRFSRCFDPSDDLPYMKDDREQEIRELRNERANLILELSEVRQNQEEILEAEREHLKNQFEQIIAIKDTIITKLKAQKEKLSEEINHEIIVLSDDSDDENEVVFHLREENHKFKCEIYNLKEAHRKEIERIESNNAKLENDLAEANQIIEDAKSSFNHVLVENKNLQLEVKDLTRELCRLTDDLKFQQMETEELRRLKILDRENIEKLEDHKEYLESICKVESPLRLRRQSSETDDKENIEPFKTEHFLETTV